MEKTKLKRLFIARSMLTIILAFMPAIIFAQSKSISGVVLDEKGGSIIGAAVSAEGTTNGTITDIDGKFTLSNIATDAIINISYIGYVSQKISTKGKNNFEITLQENQEMLDEVVVVGYGTVKKANVVGSISKVTSEIIEDRPVGRVEQALQGQMAGVSVRSTSGAPGSDITINVRGAASISGESTPLYVVDGVPIDNLGGINPSDILSIDVLKDAASAAIYGSRGSNGVVLVTTKQGKEGKPVITLNAYTAISNVERKMNIMDGSEWIAFNKKWYDRQWINKTKQSADVSQADRIAYAEAATGKKYTTREELSGIRNNYGIYDPWWGTDELEYVDWQDELFRTASTNNTQLSITGGSKVMNYSVSAGAYSQEGIIHGSSFDRYTARARIEAQVNNRIKIGLNLSPSYSMGKGAQVEGKNNAVNTALILPGVVFAGSGRQAGSDPYKYYDLWGPGPNKVNAYVMATAVDRRRQDVRMNSSLSTTVNIIKGLDVQGMVSWNYRAGHDRTYTPTGASEKWSTAKHPGELSNSEVGTSQSNSLLYQGLVTYQNTWGAHGIDVMLGASQESSSTNTTLQRQSNFANDKTWVFDKDSGARIDKNSVGYVKNALLSYFGRAQYALLDRYLLTLSLRRDGSSKFGSENRWGFFPSVAGAWKINQEPFLQNIDWIGTTKLRLSWGQAGNDRIGTALFLSNMGALNYPTGDSQALQSGFVVNNIANSMLGWETTSSYNIGVDFGVLNNRIYFSADYYNKNTKDLLLKAPVSLITGFENMMDNVGSVKNWGMEFDLNTANIVTKNFRWNSSLNISFNRNEITSLGSDNSDIRFGQGNTVIQRVGHSINSYMLLRAERTLRTDDFESDGTTPKPGIAIYTGQKPGDTKWTDTDNSGTITSADYDVVGSYQPDFEWGFTNSFTWGNFDASVLLQGRVGGDLLSVGSRSWNRATNVPQYTGMDRWLNNSYWSEDNPGDGKTPAFFATVTGNQYDTNWLYDAGYVRIKNITLGYTLPLKSNNIIRKARFYMSCDNVYMWDNYDPGFSPEAATQDNSSADWGSYPQSRTFSLGVNLTF